MQFFLYLIVGGLSFVVDIGVFVGLRLAEMPVIPASVASFVVATGANYLLSIAFAFQGGRFRRHVELVRFLAVVLVGLVLNTAFVWLFVYEAGIAPILAKIIAVPIVLVWNYLGRRWLVFHAEIPVLVSSWFAGNFERVPRRFAVRIDIAGRQGRGSRHSLDPDKPAREGTPGNMIPTRITTR